MVPLISIVDVNSNRSRPMHCPYLFNCPPGCKKSRSTQAFKLYPILYPVSCIMYSIFITLSILYYPLHPSRWRIRKDDFIKQNSVINSIISWSKELSSKIIYFSFFKKKHICKSCNIHENHLNSVLCKTINK